MKKRLTLPFLALLTLAQPSMAHDPESIALNRLRDACARAGISQANCATAEPVVRAAFSAAARTGGGISYADARNENEPEHASIEVDVNAFYFSPRILEVDVGQVVTFRNVSPPGGNPHVVSSSDWLATDRALPVPGPLSWGGGAITSDRLNPGDAWDWTMEPSESTGSGIPLGIDKVLIPYHCNVHGASQMNGFLLLRTREY